MTHQPTRVKVVLRRLDSGWSWRLLDYFFTEVERGGGYRTYKAAKAAAGQARRRYFAALEPGKINSE